MTTRHDDDPDEESEVLSKRRDVHYHYDQNKNGDSASSKYNTMMLACILAIMGFLGVKIWDMSERVTRVETNVSTLLARP